MIDIWDLVKFIMCTLVSRLNMTFYILTKGSQSLGTRVHMTILTISDICGSLGKNRLTVLELQTIPVSSIPNPNTSAFVP